MNTSVEIKPVNPFSNFVDVIATPSTAYRRISEVQLRSWWFPALLALVGALLYLGVTLSETVAEAAKQVQVQIGAMPPEQADAARPMIERFTSAPFIFGSGAVTVAIGLVIGWLIASALLYFGASVGGASLKFGKLWAVVVWSWLPFALRAFLQSAWSAINGTMIHNPGLSYFVASGDATKDQTNPLFALMSQIDLFALWHVILVYIILRVIARMGTFGAILLALLYAAINLGLRVLPAWVGGAFRVG